MPIDLTGNIDRWESEDLRMFSFINTQSIPSTMSFAVYNTDGSLLSPVAVQSGQTVASSGLGMFYVFRQLPTSVGFYTYEWKAFGSGSIQNSLYTVTRGTFEIIKTEPVSFSSYGDKNNVLKVSRYLIGRGDLTERDVRPHMLAAYSYINGRLAVVTDVPLSPTPPYIGQGEEILSVYTLYGEFGGHERNEIPPSYAKLRQDFVEYLDAVVAGEAALEGVTEAIDGMRKITQFTGGIEGGTPTFGRSDWVSQEVDADVVDKEDSDRDV